jgi:hypothetical protein
MNKQIWIRADETIKLGNCRQLLEGEIVYDGPIGFSLEDNFDTVYMCLADCLIYRAFEKLREKPPMTVN